MTTKNSYFLLLVVLVGLSGCLGRKKSRAEKPKKGTGGVSSLVDIPLAGEPLQINDDETIRSFFDQDIDEFVELTQEENEDATALAHAVDHDVKTPEMEDDTQDFAWIEDDNDDQQESFDVVYFDFNKHTIRQDQKEHVDYDIAQVQELVSDTTNDAEPTIVIEGHACHSAGSSVYNLALSEKRAKTVADEFIAAGISQENVKIVGRGNEVPAIIDGKPVEGDRKDQWPNRRVEVHTIYS